jgi:dTDP-3-amino-3,4,6-trideoxy-alpha-D-glucose transaminase
VEAATVKGLGTRPAIRFSALERQHAPIEHKLHGAFVRQLRSAGTASGDEVDRFESEFANYAEVAHCVGVASGTSAITLMLRGYGIGRGDEVLVAGHAPAGSVLAIVHAGATPVLCDVEERTGLIDPDAARAAAGPNAVAILAIHLYGQVCNMAAIEAVAKPAGLLVLEDAGPAPGARYCGHRAGSLGAAAAFSFDPHANLAAFGNAGAVCTDDDVLALRLRRLRNLGQRSDGEYFELGYDERLDAVEAAMLRVKLPHLDAWNDARSRHARHYRELLAGDIWLGWERPESPSVNHVFPVRLPRRDAVARAMAADGVETRVHYPQTADHHPAWWTRKLRHGMLTRAERWAEEQLSLPIHPGLLESEIERVVESLVTAARPEPRRRAPRPVLVGR